jgi:hypothetical protein
VNETPTPRSIAAYQEACSKKFEAHKLSHLFLFACDLERDLTAEREAREKAEKERDAARAEAEQTALKVETYEVVHALLFERLPSAQALGELPGAVDEMRAEAARLRALMAEAMRDFHGRTVLFSSAFLKQAELAAIRAAKEGS